jgi:hypothetical protein
VNPPGGKGLVLDQPPASLEPAHLAAGPDCDVAAFGVVEATPDALPTLRKHPQPPGARAIPPSFLKYSDDQTVVGLAAVLRAIHDRGLDKCDFTNWAVVAAPRFLGRTTFSAALDRFYRQGAAVVSPLIPPFLSLHALSSVISMALQSHGVNLGVGGGEGGLVEALLTALSVAAEQPLPGLWVVATEWDPEPSVGEKGLPTGPSLCRAVALAFVPRVRNAQYGVRPEDAVFRLSSVLGGADPSQPFSGSTPPLLADLAAFLLQRGGPGSPRRWVCPLRWGGSLEVTATGAPAVYRPPLVA